MLKIIVMFIVSIFNLCLQSTWFNAIPIFGCKFNTSILIIISFALINGEVEGATLGFFTGLMQDIMFGKLFGFYAILGMVLGFLIGRLNKQFVKDNLVVAVVFGIIGSFLYEFFVYIFLILAKGDTNIILYIRRVILPETIINSFAMVLIYKLINYISAKFNKFEIDTNSRY